MDSSGQTFQQTSEFIQSQWLGQSGAMFELPPQDCIIYGVVRSNVKCQLKNSAGGVLSVCDKYFGH